MIDQDLLFLGLLMNGPKHGYEIKRHIEQELTPYISLQLKSIYYPLTRMEHEGLISKEVGREGKWPEKFIYRITLKGKKKFAHLITKSLLSVERPFFQLDLSLYFLQYVDEAIAKRRLKGRLLLLKKVRSELEHLSLKLKTSQKILPLIIQHNLDLVDAEIRSSLNLINQL